MDTMPKPRKKQWWELLLEKQFDHFYEEADNIKFADQFVPIYRIILEHRKMKEVVQIQRFFRKILLNRWMRKNKTGEIRTWVKEDGTQ